MGQLQQTTWVGSTGSTHGTHVASTILGYSYRSNSDTAGGFPLPPIQVRGIAPDVTVIPVKVLSDYQVPALPKCTDPGPQAATKVVFGTSAMVAAGIRYATDLKRAGYSPMVINMSLGGSELEQVEKDAIDYAIANGVIVVAAAGNDGETGMGFPGAYPPVISAGAIGWTKEWLKPTDGLPRYRMWWLKDSDHVPPLLPGTGEVADPTQASDIYVTDFSSRELPGQELDVLAPGSWVRGPFPGSPGLQPLAVVVERYRRCGRRAQRRQLLLRGRHVDGDAAHLRACRADDAEESEPDAGSGGKHPEVDDAAAGRVRLA